uniref:4-hydroxyphenylpyruvate dioxygenase n=2 Tax=Emiliania huxleyi TaxID=2903 RepID=A0A7S3WK82_EMIHU
MRAVTGEGVTFLNIPRTYYGLLEPESLVSVDTELRRDGCPSGLAEPLALELVAALRAAGLLDAAGALSLDADAAAIDAALGGVVGYRDAPAATREMVGRVVCRSVYVNLWKLLGPQLSEATYLSIVRNQILIDVQGEDVLLQIFTSVVLQREPGTEAPFLEFIQRVCAECSGAGGAPQPIRPGCGGFGIRNFLTLFLSIEVSKAMLDSERAAEQGRDAEAAFHQRRVRLFTDQLVEANPVLTEISDCMTAEGRALDAGDADAAAEWGRRKDRANLALAECSQKYNRLMGELREEGWGDSDSAA